MNTPTRSRSLPLQRVPVYEVRLVQARKALRLAESNVSDPTSAARALHSLIGMTDREHFACLFVNARHQVTGAHIAAIGGQHSMGVDVRALLRAALMACAAGIILGHNHPSGDPSPSPEDLSTTANIIRAGKLLGIAVLDHLIITRAPLAFHSMALRGTLPNADT